MKLARVWLDFSVQFPGMDMAKSELNEDDCHAAGYDSMRYDPELGSLVLGNSNGPGYGIAWGRVIRWEQSDIQLVCDRCDGSFKSAQALGGHKRFCKVEKEKSA